VRPPESPLIGLSATTIVAPGLDLRSLRRANVPLIQGDDLLDAMVLEGGELIVYGSVNTIRKARREYGLCFAAAGLDTRSGPREVGLVARN